MNDDVPVTRRELDQRLSSLREHLDWQHSTDQQALLLQRGIDEVHFEKLNGEAQRIQAVLAQSVPREVFENYKEDELKWRDSLTSQLTEDREARRRELAHESETRRKELSGEVRPLQDRVKFGEGRDMGLLALGVTVGGIVVGALTRLL